MNRKPVQLHFHAGRDAGFDLDELLHPAQAFEHPSQVVNDPDLTLNEKRAILASWASDACAVEAAPALRQGANGKTVTFDEIMEALRSLDEEARAADGRARYKKRLRITEVTDRLTRKLRKPSGDGGYGAPGSFN
jgi:uncharacterized caspase-like protein